MGILIELLLRLVFQVPFVRTIILAVVPALLLLLYARRKDRLEPEPPKLIWSLVGLGALSTALAMVLELGGLFVLTRALDPDSVLFSVLQWFLVVGLAEECSKYLMLHLRTWKNPEFNCLYDGLVYAVAVSAGFALLENLVYLIQYGPSVVFIRAIVSIPAHICFSVFMGTWYSAAKKHAIAGNPGMVRRSRILAITVPALAHGAFDMIAGSAGSGVGIAVFVIYVIAMFIVCWRIIKKMAENDRYIIGSDPL